MAPTRLTDAEWLQHKPSIRRMIIDQNLTQDETRQQLKDGGIEVTKAQLEYKLKIWGFRKKAPKEKSDAIWQFIAHRVEKRKRQQKASDVFLNGQRVDPAKARKEINRHRPTSLVKLKQGRSWNEPENARVIGGNHSHSGVNPRYITFVAKLPPMVSLRAQSSPLVAWGLSTLSVASGNAPTQIVIRAERPFLHSISHVQGGLNKQDPSRLAVEIGLIMPEAHRDENATRAQVLLHGSVADVTTERLKILLYQASNKLANPHIDDEVIKLLEDSGIMQMPLQLGRMMDTALHSIAESLFQQALKTLYSQRVNTSKEFMLNGLPSWRVIKWLLSSGQNPNVPIQISVGKHLTPLEVAVDMSCLPLVSLLLDAKLNTTSAYEDPMNLIQGIIQAGISHTERVQLLKRFLKDEAIISFLKTGRQWRLLANILDDILPNFEAPSLELIDILMDDGAKMCLKGKDYPALGWTSSSCNILGYAAGLITESVAVICLSHFLSKAQQSEPLLPPASFITPDVIFHAVLSGHNKILEFLLEIHVDLTCSYQGVTALHVAAYSGRLEMCQKLLQLGVPVDGYLDFQHPPTPLHLAAYYGRLEIIQLLHSHGADLTRCLLGMQRSRIEEIESIYTERAASPVGAVLLSRNHQASKFFAQHGVPFPPWAAHHEVCERDPQPYAVRLALEMGADPNWTENGFTVLERSLGQRAFGSAKMSQMVHIAMILLDAGAALRGGEIYRAVFLNDWDLVSRLLEMAHFGTSQQDDLMSILQAAIVTGNQHFIDRLLDMQGDLIPILQAAIVNSNQSLTDRLLEMAHFDTSQQFGLMSILETAIVDGNQHLVAQIFTHFPDAYDAGALCAAVLFEDHGSETVELLLNSRPKVGDASPLESLAIGIAAGRKRDDLLDLLLAKLQKPSLAALPERVIHSLTGSERVRDFFDTYYIHQLSYHRSMSRAFWRDEPTILGSPLTLALMSGNPLCRLLDHGFLPDRLTMSIAANLDRHGPIQKLAQYRMLSSGFDDYEGPLATAVRRNHIDGVRSLLDGNYCVNEDNSHVRVGRSPLQIAVENGHSDLIELLLGAGADVNAPAARDRGATALQLAAIQGYIGVAKMLIDLGADVNTPGSGRRGRTALEGAAEHGRIDTIQYILSQGVKTKGEGRISYLRAVRYAELEGHMVAAKLLKTWRGWTVDDNALWARLRSLSRWECEQIIEKVEYDGDLESELESHGLEEVHGGDGMADIVFDGAPFGDGVPDVVFDGAPFDEVSAHELLDTANVLGGMVELEDLEMMTNDTFAFWSGLDFGVDGV
ncbi:hypothetical protein GCG54_00002787 [Colletotrichum gloeosporioides]|uniref:Clr5 domain-containing protein n=1 Tax=Colletotrichum gloeosporioides TaxID=474922 RepID=A0A8H4FKG4_COLGL|nr:uncharacterized protein GCG54_00002787 [Colletotrichum gloeosporioides]KAF3805442.1 hypothetical protein GCG54_00002787 [Colletotrichum gloeosporioides]